MGVLYGFAPWLVFWLLIGNTPFTLAAVTALGVAGSLVAISRLSKSQAPGLFHIGAAVTFAMLTAAAVVFPATGQWALPVSYVGAAVTTWADGRTRHSFIGRYAAAGQPRAVVASDEFAVLTRRLGALWMALFAAMALSSAMASGTHFAVDVFSWVIPAVLLAIGATASALLPERMLAGAADIVRKTTFVAYSEATIDELYYLAREHAGREVGGGQEPYDIKVGAAGTPLVGDESRLSWPSTYKVRALKR